MNLRTQTFTVLFLGLLAGNARAEDWYRWRGPNSNGTSAETGWNDKWSQSGPPVVWKAQVGTGFSSITVSDGRAYTMGNEDQTDTVFCLDAVTGDELWRYSYECPLGDNLFEGGPTSTPTVDDGSVYTLSRQGHLFGFEASTGKVRWSKNIQQETRARIPSWGFSSSALVHDNLLLLNVGEAGTAVEKSTGKLVWTSADREAGYATPIPIRHEGVWKAIIFSGKFLLAVEIETGKELWRHRWLTRFGVNAADPILSGKHIFISSGYNRGAALLDIAEEKPKVVWENKEMRNQLNSSILIDGFLYGIDGDTTREAALKCMELSTGRVKWNWEGIGSGSLIAAAGKLIVLSDEGELIVSKASPVAFEPTARAQVLDGKCWTAPVLANGRIYCRNADGDVVCLDVRGR